MSKARRFMSCPWAPYPFYHIRQPALHDLYHLCLEVHCIRSELHLFMVKAFPLLKLIMTSTDWGAVSTTFYSSLVWRGLEPESSPSRSGCATTKPNLLGIYNEYMFVDFLLYREKKCFKVLTSLKFKIFIPTAPILYIYTI